MSEEVNLGDNMDDDYEVVPVGPIRKLERRLDDIETKAEQGSGSRADDELVRDVLDIMKSNQKIVNDMTQSTHDLKNNVEDLTHKMDEVIDNMNSFMNLLHDASEADLEGEIVSDMHTRIADAVGDRMEEVASDMKESNQAVVENLEQINESIRRNYASDNKSNVLNRRRKQRQGSGQNNQSQGRQGQSRNQQPQGQGGNNQSRGLEIDRNQGGNEQSGSGRGNRDERMRKLRERFNEGVNEE